jgi:hypothetical protein
MYAGSVVTTAVHWGTTRTHVVVARFSGAIGSGLSVDGAPFVTGAVGAGGNVDLWVGKYSAGENWQGTVCEVIAMSGVISDADVSKVNAYLTGKWIVPSPIPTTGLSGWWDADDTATITASAGAVSAWGDKSPSGFDVSQATSTKRPTWGATTLNGRNVITFDGTADGLVRASPVQIVNATTGEWSAFAVARPTTVSGARNIFDQTAGGAQIAQYIRHNGTTVEAIAFSGGSAFTDTVPSAVAANVAKCYSVTRSATAVEIWVDGVSNGPTVATGTPTVLANQALTIGANQSAGFQFFQGDIAEVIAYNRVLTTTERQQVESYLKTKWGTP